MSEIHIFGVAVSWGVMIPLVFLAWMMAALFVKRIVFRVVKEVARKTKTNLDDIFISSVDLPATLFIFAAGCAIVNGMMPLGTDNPARAYFTGGFKAVSIVAVILFFDKFFNALIHAYSGVFEILKTSGGIFRGFVRVSVIGLGALILMDSFGVSITPLLASLGITSLAVALALQSTLENFFAGIQMVIDTPIQVGHFVKLESGEEGYVHKIGWRSTWVRMLPDNVVVIPNKVIVNSKVINYHYPQKELAVLVEVGVHYGSDLDLVERVTKEVAKQTLKDVEGGIPEFDPFIRYHTFGDFSINFTVFLRAKEFMNTYIVKHEFIKKLHKRYALEGITIPYPIRAVNYTQEKALEIPGNRTAG